MIVYIAGKIGEEVISDATREKFLRAQRMLESKGFHVFNPTAERWQQILERNYEHDVLMNCWIDGEITKYSYVLLRDLGAIASKDAVYFMQDSRLSPGSLSEKAFAVATGKRLFFEMEVDAVEYLKRLFWNLADKNAVPEEYLGMPWNEAEDLFVKNLLPDTWIPIEEGGEK